MRGGGVNYFSLASDIFSINYPLKTNKYDLFIIDNSSYKLSALNNIKA